MIHQFINNGIAIVMDINSGSVHVADPVFYDAVAAAAPLVGELEKPEPLQENVKEAVRGAWQKVTEYTGQLKENVTKKFDEMKANVKQKIDTIKSDMSSKWNQIKSDAVTKVTGMKTDITSRAVRKT